MLIQNGERTFGRRRLCKTGRNGMSPDRDAVHFHFQFLRLGIDLDRLHHATGGRGRPSREKLVLIVKTVTVRIFGKRVGADLGFKTIPQAIRIRIGWRYRLDLWSGGGCRKRDEKTTQAQGQAKPTPTGTRQIRHRGV